MGGGWGSCVPAGPPGTRRWERCPQQGQVGSPEPMCTHISSPKSLHRAGELHTPSQAVTAGFCGVWDKETLYETQKRKPSSLLAPKNALQPPNPAVLPTRADGELIISMRCHCSLCGPAEPAMVVAASNEENWCVFVWFPLK